MTQRHYCANLNQLATDFADYCTSVLCKSLANNQKASLVIPGGNTPRHYLPSLGQRSIRWRDVTITLSDERWVDPKTTTSNERLITENFLNYMPETACFLGLKTHHYYPSQAIDAVNENLANVPLPFSLTVLGLGEDGHVASLFPGMKPDLENDHLCVAVEPPVAPSARISLTLKALTNSQNIVVVATGAVKRRLIDKLTGKFPDPQIPFVWLMQYSHSPIIIFETNET